MMPDSIFLSSSIGFYFTLVFLCLYGIVHFLFKYQQNKIHAGNKSARDNFKKASEKIIVRYDELEIKTRSWKQEIEVGSGTNSRNEYIDVNHNYIFFKKLHRGHYFEEELVIDMEPEVIRMKLAYQNELSLYYNPNDLNEFFLDLEFLFQ